MMTTTMMTTTVEDLPMDLERWARRTAGMTVEFSVRPSAGGGVVVTITTPTGLPIPFDPGDSPLVTEARQLRTDVANLDQLVRSMQARLDEAERPIEVDSDAPVPDALPGND